MFNLQVTAQDSALDLALAYAEYGISVVPLHRHNKVPPKELGGWQKFQERQPTTEEIEKWFNSIIQTFNTLKEVKGTKLENNYLVIRYEDLVHNHKKEMKRVEDFIGLSIDPNYVNFYEAANYRRMMSSPEIMGDKRIPVREDSAIEGALGSDHTAHRPIAPDSIGRWKRPIHKDRMKEILKKYENKLSDMLIELNYEKNKKWLNEFK